MQKKRFVPDAGGEFPEWEEVEFGKLFQRRGEKNKNKEFGFEKTISVANMHFKPEGNRAADESLPNYKIMRFGDIAYEGHTSKEFKHGRFVLNDIGDGIVSPIFEVLKPISTLSSEVPVFWKYYIHYEPVMRKLLAKCANTGIMMNRLAIDDFYKLKIKVPCIEEQRKIAAALAAYDAMIGVKTEKLEAWQAYKSAMMDDIFEGRKKFVTEDGKEFPEWEEKRLGEVAEINPSTKNKIPDEFYYMDLGSVEAGNWKSKKEIQKKNAPSRAQRIAEVDDVFFQSVRPLNKDHFHYTEKADKPVVASTGFIQLRMNDGENGFLYQLLYERNFNKQVRVLTAGSNYPAINATNFSKITARFPCMEEQQKIGSFLEKIDREIQIQKEYVKTYTAEKERAMRELMG